MSENSATTNWLDVIRSAFWPVVALICLVVFGSPIREALSNILSTTGPAQEIEVGPVKLKLSVQAVRAIKPPPPKIAASLGKLSSEEVEKLLSLGPDVSITTCPAEFYMYRGGGDGEIYEGLKRVGFVQIAENPEQGDLGWCQKGKYQLSRLTDDGLRARAYILDIVSKALTITKS